MRLKNLFQEHAPRRREDSQGWLENDNPIIQEAQLDTPTTAFTTRPGRMFLKTFSVSAFLEQPGFNLLLRVPLGAIEKLLTISGPCLASVFAKLKKSNVEKNM